MPLAVRMVQTLIYVSPTTSLTLMVSPVPDGLFWLGGAIDDPDNPEGDAMNAFDEVFFEDADTALRVGSEYAIRYEGGTLDDVKSRTLDWSAEYMPLDIEVVAEIPTASNLPIPVPLGGYVN